MCPYNMYTPYTRARILYRGLSIGGEEEKVSPKQALGGGGFRGGEEGGGGVECGGSARLENSPHDAPLLPSVVR
jgi:hypothetical protein